MTQPRSNDAHEQAEAQLQNIKAMMSALLSASSNTLASEEAEQTIQESPLEISVRSDWHSPGQDSQSPGEYRILLCTGGPAVRLTGTLNEYGDPESVQLQYQDWFTPWIEYRLTSEEETQCLQYAREFYFGP